MNQEKYNQTLLTIISEYLAEHKNSNFMEALYNTGILPIITKVSEMYYESSENTVERANKVKIKGHI